MLIINIKDKLTVSFRKGGYSKDNTSILLSQKMRLAVKLIWKMEH